MSDNTPSRPRPQYGEYATPDEQRAHIREPIAEPEIAATPYPDALPQPPVVQVTSAPDYVGHAPLAPVPAPEKSLWKSLVRAFGEPNRRIDVMITVALLVWGLFEVVRTVVAMLSFSDAMTEQFQLLGLTYEQASHPRDQLWGTVIALVFLGGYLLTVYLSLARIRAGKKAWWIPLVGAVVTFIIVAVAFAIAMAGDPAMVILQQTMMDSLVTPSETPTP